MKKADVESLPGPGPHRLRRPRAGGSTSAPAESGAAPAGSEAPASASQEESGYDRREAIERPEIGAEVVIDPPYDFDPAEMVPGDFGDYFTDCDHPTQVSTYKLAEGPTSKMR